MKRMNTSFAVLFMCCCVICFACVEIVAQNTQRKRVKPIPTQTPQTPPGRVNPLPQISPEEKATTEAKAALSKEQLEIETLKASASAEVRDLFFRHFIECDGYYSTKGKNRFSHSSPDVRVIPVYWFEQYQEVKGFEGGFDTVQKLAGADKLNNPNIEWEANFEIKANYYRASEYRKERDVINDSLIFFNYEINKWSEWQSNSFGDILKVKLWKPTNGKWEVKEHSFVQFPHDPDWSGEIRDLEVESTTYLRPTCQEVKSRIPREILRLKGMADQPEESISFRPTLNELSLQDAGQIENIVSNYFLGKFTRCKDNSYSGTIRGEGEYSTQFQLIGLKILYTFLQSEQVRASITTNEYRRYVDFAGGNIFGSEALGQSAGRYAPYIEGSPELSPLFLSKENGYWVVKSDPLKSFSPGRCAIVGR